MSIEIKKAVRKAVPLVIGVTGVSGSGKTYGAMLLAAGIVEPGDKIGYIDTENGRGTMYADDPGIVQAMPQGYDIAELHSDFHPSRYIEMIDEFERRGYKALVIDSVTHEYEGKGGITDIAEADKNRWNRAKAAHKRFVNRLLASNMHIIVCLRAREKSKIAKVPDPRKPGQEKEEIISLGIMPVQEKNFVFELTVSLMVDEKTHMTTPLKCPAAVQHLFREPKLISKSDGEEIRKWNNSGRPLEDIDRLRKQASIAAENGVEAYRSFFESLSAGQRKSIEPFHATYKQAAIDADKSNEIPVYGSTVQHVSWPDNFDGPRLYWNGDLYEYSEDTGNYRQVDSKAA